MEKQNLSSTNDTDDERTLPEEDVIAAIQLAEFWRLEREAREIRTTQNMRPLKKP